MTFRVDGDGPVIPTQKQGNPPIGEAANKGSDTVPVGQNGQPQENSEIAAWTKNEPDYAAIDKQKEQRELALGHRINKDFSIGMEYANIVKKQHAELEKALAKGNTVIGKANFDDCTAVAANTVTLGFASCSEAPQEPKYEDYFDPDKINIYAYANAESDAVTNASANVTVNFQVLTNEPGQNDQDDQLDAVSGQMVTDNNGNLIDVAPPLENKSDNPALGNTSFMYMSFALTGETGELTRVKEDNPKEDKYVGSLLASLDKEGNKKEIANARVIISSDVETQSGIPGLRKRVLQVEKDGEWVAYDVSILKPVNEDGVKMVQVFSARAAMVKVGNKDMSYDEYIGTRCDILKKNGVLHDEPKSPYFQSKGKNLNFPEGCNFIMIQDGGFQEVAVKNPITGKISYQRIEYYIKNE